MRPQINAHGGGLPTSAKLPFDPGESQYENAGASAVLMELQRFLYIENVDAIPSPAMTLDRKKVITGVRLDSVSWRFLLKIRLVQENCD